MSRPASSTRPALWARLLRRTKTTPTTRTVPTAEAAAAAAPPTPVSSTSSSFSTFSGFGSEHSGLTPSATPVSRTPSSMSAQQYGGGQLTADAVSLLRNRSNPATPAAALRPSSLLVSQTGPDVAPFEAALAPLVASEPAVTITGDPRLSTMMRRRRERRDSGARALSRSRPVSCPGGLGSGAAQAAATAALRAAANAAGPREGGLPGNQDPAPIELGAVGTSKLFARRRAARMSASLKLSGSPPEPAAVAEAELPVYLATPERRTAFMERAARDVVFGFDGEVELWPQALLRDLKRASSAE